MSFSVAQKGIKSVQRSLFALAQRSPRLLVDSVDEVNKRHAKAYRRRTIPRDTGRLEASLATTSHRDRYVRASVRGVQIGTRTPYARYQRKRIAPLSPRELRDIFVDPIRESFRELAKGGR